MQSKSFTKLASAESRRLYGSAQLKGVEAKDLTCIVPHSPEEIAEGNFSFCKKDFEWFMVTSENGLNDDYAGVCGLSRSKFTPGEGEREEGPLLVREMALEGQLGSNVFAFYMDSYEREIAERLPTFIDFGGI